MGNKVKTEYPGVFFRIVPRPGKPGKTEKSYYVTYKVDGKKIEEACGRQYRDNMTPAKAATYRGERIEGKRKSKREIRIEADEAQKEKETAWTVTRLWKKYIESNPGLKGIVTDKNRFEKYIEPAFGDMEPKDIIPLDIIRVRNKLLKKKSVGTVKNVLELLRRIVNFGRKSQLCAGVSFTIEMPEMNNEKTEDLSPEQLAILLQSIDKDIHPQAGPIMKIALYTGMRRSEIFRLEWSDIDFEKSFIKIRNPKGGKDQTIPLNDAAKALLENYPKNKKSEFVFPGKGGKMRTDIKKAVNKIRDDAGLPKTFRALHGLRHTYASMLASSGQVDMYTLQKLLTHKSPQMTQRYAHLRDDTLKKASNLAGTLVNEAISKNADRNEKITTIGKKND